MTLEPLHCPFIGITLYVDDYAKVKGLFPTPTYTDTLHSHYNQKIILIYTIEGYVTSYNQYRWISNIKLGLQKFLCVPFEFEEEFYITADTEMTDNIYQIKELSQAFKASLITYPKIMYPPSKKELYKHLCWYGKRLIHQKVFTKEAMISTALLMNSKLKDKYSNKDLQKKVVGAYIFINLNRESFSVGLDQEELQKAQSKGGKVRKAKQAQNTKERIDKLLEDNTYIKPNGKVNKTLLSKALAMNRRTLDKYFN